MKFFSIFAIFLGFIPASAAALGGWRDVPIDDPGVVAAAAFAVRQSTQREGVKYDIIKAESQVV